jgi:hypothetical protein
MKVCLFLLASLFLSCANPQKKSEVHHRTENKQYKNWSSADYGNISFMYPSDWIVQRDTFENAVKLSVTPIYMKNNNLKIFEIVQIASTEKFEDFKTEVYQTVFTRTNGQAAIHLRTDTTFKDLESMYTEALLFHRTENPLPCRIFAINGGEKFYAITMIGRYENDSAANAINAYNSAILNSIEIQKK